MLACPALILLRQVANELLSRAERVLIITRNEVLRVEELRREPGGAELERALVEAVSLKHACWLADTEAG